MPISSFMSDTFDDASSVDSLAHCLSVPSNFSVKKIELLILFSYLRYLIIFSHRRNDLVCTAIGVRKLRDDTRANYVFFVTLVFRRVNSFENRFRTSVNLFKAIIESLLRNIMTFVRGLRDTGYSRDSEERTKSMDITSIAAFK